MHTFLVSTLVAAMIVGSVFHSSFLEVSANNQFLAQSYATADVVEAIVAHSDVSHGSSFTPLWQRAQHVHVPTEPMQVEADEQTTEVETSLAAGSKPAAPADVEESATALEPVPVAVRAVAEVPAPELLLPPKSIAAASKTPVSKAKKRSSPPADPLDTLVYEAVNKTRTDYNLAPLITDETLATMAAAHSDDMAERDFLSHTNPDDCDLTCRFKISGHAGIAWAENIALVEKSHLISEGELAKYAVESWLESKGHRQNLINEIYTHMGVGIARDGDDIFVTINFALVR